MPRFLFAYHGGKAPDSPEEGEKIMAAWGAWFGQIGAALKDPGAPVGPSQTVSAKGVSGNSGTNPVSGHTLVEADDMAAALQIARGCPMVVSGSGSVEVAEITGI